MGRGIVYEDEIVSYNPIYGDLVLVDDFSECTQRSNGETDHIAGYLAWFELNNGFRKELYMTKEEVKHHALTYSKSYQSDVAKGRQSSRWSIDFDAMALKGLALDTPIPTPTGWTTMENISVGDTVFDMDGNEAKVIAVSEVKNLPCYKITFSNGDIIICDNEHKWLAETGTNASRRIKKSGWREISADDLYGDKQKHQRIRVPNNPPLSLKTAELEVDPWMLGYWLGNGASYHARITCSRDDVDYVKTRIEAAGYEVGAIRNDPRSNAVDVGVHGLREQLEAVDVLKNKHIPMKYLRGSYSQRKSLLAGLMDSDGCVAKSKRCRATFSTTNAQMAEEVFELVTSLGEIPYKSEHQASGFGVTTTAYCIGWTPSFCPVEMPRKMKNYRDRLVEKYRAIKSIEKIDTVPTKCIAVDSETKTYLAGKSMVPTHNTVTKRLLSQWGILSIEMQRAMQEDQKVYTADGNGYYTDNPKADELPAAATADSPVIIDAETTEPEPDPEMESLFGDKE